MHCFYCSNSTYRSKHCTEPDTLQTQNYAQVKQCVGLLRYSRYSNFVHVSCLLKPAAQSLLGDRAVRGNTAYLEFLKALEIKYHCTYFILHYTTLLLDLRMCLLQFFLPFGQHFLTGICSHQLLESNVGKIK